jgi:hypothetical protein
VDAGLSSDYPCGAPGGRRCSKVEIVATRDLVPSAAGRAYLAKHGVDRSRVLLRPLGNRRSGGDSDCVEVVTLQ